MRSNSVGADRFVSICLLKEVVLPRAQHTKPTCTRMLAEAGLQRQNSEYIIDVHQQRPGEGIRVNPCNNSTQTLKEIGYFCIW